MIFAIPSIMRIIAAADIHGKQYRINQFIDSIEEYSPDLAIICGDITHFGPGELAKELLDQIPIETLAIPGNVDTPDVLTYIEKSKAVNLHLSKIERQGHVFVGLGESDKLPFQFHKGDRLKEKVSLLLERDCIFVTHVPPYGAQDSVFFGMHAGSKWIRELIEKYQPLLHFCGHIHEDPGFSNIGKTHVVNCSMGKRGRGAIVDINEKVEIKMLEE